MFYFRKSRKTFDTTETRQEFGPIVIDYGKVQILQYYDFIMINEVHT